MSYRLRRLRRHPVELDITAFMNMIVVLVPFLLSTTVFSRLAVLELNLPAAATGPTAIKQDLQLEVIIRPRSLEVSDRNHGMIQRIADNDTGHDYHALSLLMQQLKARFPDKLEATVLAEPDTPYDHLVQVMDAVRTARVGQGAKTHSVEVFPEISVGDAPPAGDIREPAKKGSAP